MSVARYLPEDELIKRGLQALMDALGPVETIRFINLPREVRLESVDRHRQWQASLDQQELFKAVFGTKPEGSEIDKNQ